MTTRKLGQGLKAREQKPQSREVSTSKTNIVTLKEDQDGKLRLGEALHMFHDALKTYGKEADQLESVTKLFIFALADYPVGEIIDALAYYSKNFSDFPAPADIVSIIKRGGKPPFSEAVYVRINKKHPADRSTDDWEYLESYETFILRG